MKKILFILITLAASVFAQDTVKVTGDRVSLRAAPDTNAVLLSRANLDEELILTDNSNPGWVGVSAPERVDLWVSGEFVSNSVVLPEILNIRSGPSLSHSVVGSAVKGDALVVRGEAGGWLKIAPTPKTTVWISREYVQLPSVLQDVPVETLIVVQETQAVVQVVAAPVVQESAPAVSAPVQKKLLLDPARPQETDGVYSGVLKPADGGFYQLIDDHFSDIIVCYVSGNAAQMKTFSGMKLEVSGKVYWVEGQEYPVIRPLRIKPYATLPAK